MATAALSAALCGARASLSLASSPARRSVASASASASSTFFLSWGSSSSAASCKRSLHSSASRRSEAAKDAGPVETLLKADQATLAAQAARTIDPAGVKGGKSPKIDQIADMICALNLVEAMHLSETLKQKLGVPANYFPARAPGPITGSVMQAAGMVDGLHGAPGGGAAPAAAAGGAAPAPGGAKPAAPAPAKEEKLTVDIKLKAYKAENKIKVIKEVRAITNLGLKEAKELVESAPCTILAKVKKEDAAKIVEKLKADTGAELEMA